MFAGLAHVRADVAISRASLYRSFNAATGSPTTSSSDGLRPRTPLSRARDVGDLFAGWQKILDGMAGTPRAVVDVENKS